VKRIFPIGTTPKQLTVAVTRMVQGLDTTKAWSVEIQPWKPPRTHQQNAFLYGVVYPSLIEGAGELLAGWELQDIHEYFLGEWAGIETITGFGRERTRPLKRSSKLTKQEFSDYLEFISQRCADLGIVIPVPEEPCLSA